MKKELLSSMLLSILCIVLFCIVYPALLWTIAQFAPNRGEGFIVTASNGKRYFENIGQKFNANKYFWSRPSAVDYNACGSGGSNKGPANPELLNQVQIRIDTFLLYNTAAKTKDIPVDLITASGSGLDPDISIASALVQVQRVAKVRGLTENAVKELVYKNTEKSLWGIMGPKKINVLKLNLDLDKK